MRATFGVSLGRSLFVFAFLALALTSFLAQAVALPPDPQDTEKEVDLPTEDPGIDLSTSGPTTIIEDDGSTNGTVSAPAVISVPLASLEGSTVPQNIVDDVKKSLPQVLHDEGLTDAEIAGLTDAEIAEILAALNEFFENGEGHDDSDDVAVAKRDWLAERGVADWIKGRICRAFARITRPAFMAAAGLFNLKNSGSGSGIFHYQKFFLYPLHRTLFDNRINVRVYYKANWVVKKFWGSAGVAFGKKIYVRKSYEAWSSTSSQFYTQVSLLAHELQHTQQYYNRHWSIWDFAYHYLYSYCRAGFSYSKNAMEVEAKEAAKKISKLLSTGRGFFHYWRVKALYSKLGYPVETSYRDVRPDVRELNFQKGKMQIEHDRNPDCYRYKVGSSPWTTWDCRRL
jgi:hypothetical protein